MNVNKVVAAIGGALIGIGSTLIVQKLRKDVDKTELLADLAGQVNKLADAIDPEPKENVAYREAVNENTTNTKARDLSKVKQAPTSKPTTIKTTAPEPID